MPDVTLNGVDSNLLQQVKTKQGQTQSPYAYGQIPETKPDSFEKTTEINASNDGKFTFKEAMKNLGKGIISPLTALVKNPLLTVGLLATTVAACHFLPILVPIMTVGFGALSLFELGKGGYNAISEYRKGNKDASEKAFEQVGSGLIGTVLTALGIKQSAKTVKEAKFLAETKKPVLDNINKERIAAEVKAQSWFSALKENFSLFTTKEGRAALINEFKPSTIKGRFSGENRYYKSEIENPFLKTEEGIRRSKMPKSEVEKEVIDVINKTFDDMGIPVEARPQIIVNDELRYMSIDEANTKVGRLLKAESNVKEALDIKFFNEADDLMAMTDEQLLERISNIIKTDSRFSEFKARNLDLYLFRGAVNQHGAYNSSNHTITFNASSYRAGSMPTIENTAAHEALHAKMAILRNSLSKDEVAQIIKQELLNRIKYGEAEEIIKCGGFLGNEMMTPPKMSAKMRGDFFKFADDFLYKKPSTDEATIVDKLKVFLNENPDFATMNGKTPEEALKLLKDYVKSHEIRFKSFSNTKVPQIKNPIALTPEQHAEAIESLIGRIETVEGNSRTGGILKIFGASKKDFNQYQFSYEELLARNTAAKVEKAKLQALLSDTTLSAERQAEITARIKELDFVLEYNKVGEQYYKLYTKAINNPDDTQIINELKRLEQEFDVLDNIKKAAMKEKTSKFTVEYSTNISSGFPYNTTVFYPTGTFKPNKKGE